jgi:nitrite reductase/ring-hydroxylating ferredoxin subunit
MADGERVICASGDLEASGLGVRFEVDYEGEPAAAFVVRHADGVSAYLNRCPHVRTELDWQPGAFFDFEGLNLICSTHGAVFDASTGKCLGGPCFGRALVKLTVEERDGLVVLKGFANG